MPWSRKPPSSSPAGLPEIPFANGRPPPAPSLFLQMFRSHDLFDPN
jgi:hypothetical protein